MTRATLLRALCMIGLWALASSERASADGEVDAPTWAVGVGIGHPNLLEVSVVGRPISRLYLGPTAGLILAATIRHGDALDVGLLGLSLGGVVGWEWPLWGWHGLMVEANGGYLRHLTSACYGAEGESHCTPTGSLLVGGYVGWFGRSDQTTWQVVAGVSYITAITSEATFSDDVEDVWVPGLKLVGQFGM